MWLKISKDSLNLVLRIFIYLINNRSGTICTAIQNYQVDSVLLQSIAGNKFCIMVVFNFEYM